MDSALTPEGGRHVIVCVLKLQPTVDLIPRPLECGLGMRISYTGCVVGVSLQ